MDEARRLVQMRKRIFWVAAALVLIALPAVIGLVALRGDDSSSSDRRAGALVAAGGTATAYQLQLTQAVAGTTEIKEAIVVDSFSFGVESPTTIGSATTGAGVGKIKFNEFKISKTIDNASPVLFKQVAAGTHFKKAVLTVRNAGEKDPYMTYTMETVFVTKIDHSGASPEVPSEQITFVYGKLVEQSAFKNPDGAVAKVTTGWNQILNKSDDQISG
jgi:type VI secretion system secreted protein Hcp